MSLMAMLVLLKVGPQTAHPPLGLSSISTPAGAKIVRRVDMFPVKGPRELRLHSPVDTVPSFNIVSDNEQNVARGQIKKALEIG